MVYLDKEPLNEHELLDIVRISKGVSYQQSAITTDSLVMRRSLGEKPTSTTRWIRARHHITDKFSQDGK